MNAGKIIRILRTVPPNTEVVLSIDPEGNEYSPARSHSTALLTPAGDVVATSDQKDFPDAIPCIVLWP